MHVTVWTELRSPYKVKKKSHTEGLLEIYRRDKAREQKAGLQMQHRQGGDWGTQVALHTSLGVLRRKVAFSTVTTVLHREILDQGVGSTF